MLGPEGRRTPTLRAREEMTRRVDLNLISNGLYAAGDNAKKGDPNGVFF